MDNRIFEVNGDGEELFRDTIKLAFDTSDHGGCAAWVFDREKGLVLLWAHQDGAAMFPCRLQWDRAAYLAWTWLESEEAGKVQIAGQWEEDYQHDGSNSLGWRVYVEDWGHVGGWQTVICAVKPCYLWHGK